MGDAQKIALTTQSNPHREFESRKKVKIRKIEGGKECRKKIEKKSKLIPIYRGLNNLEDMKVGTFELGAMEIGLIVITILTLLLCIVQLL